MKNTAAIDFLKSEIERLNKDRATLKEYVERKVHGDEDWHAVADGAMDLRDVDAQLVVFKDILEVLLES